MHWVPPPNAAHAAAHRFQATRRPSASSPCSPATNLLVLQIVSNQEFVSNQKAKHGTQGKRASEWCCPPQGCQLRDGRSPDSNSVQRVAAWRRLGQRPALPTMLGGGGRRAAQLPAEHAWHRWLSSLCRVLWLAATCLCIQQQGQAHAAAAPDGLLPALQHYCRLRGGGGGGDGHRGSRRRVLLTSRLLLRAARGRRLARGGLCWRCRRGGGVAAAAAGRHGRAEVFGNEVQQLGTQPAVRQALQARLQPLPLGGGGGQVPGVGQLRRLRWGSRAAGGSGGTGGVGQQGSEQLGGSWRVGRIFEADDLEQRPEAERGVSGRVSGAWGWQKA